MSSIEEACQIDSQDPWHIMEVDQVASFLGVDAVTGLSQDEAAERLVKYGPNQLSEKVKVTIWQRIWRQVNNVLVLILVIVAVVSAIKAATSTGEDAITSWVEVVLILGVIALNTYIGIRQEGSAEKSAEALKAMLPSTAIVFRDNQLWEINAANLVKGDVVKLCTGNKIPADIRLIKVMNFSCAEAALTGESVPIEKITQVIQAENPASVPLGDRKNMAFSATLVTQGEAIGIVSATGDNTEIGQINSLVNNAVMKKTNVERQIDIVSKFIALFVLIVAFTTFCLAYWGATDSSVLDAISIALVTSVAMIPEGLAAIVTLTYAYAVSEMAARNAIVRVLPAVETLGSVTVICSDKTGTLTKNEMTMVGLVTANARYKFDCDSKERTNTNFVREDSFMAHVAVGNSRASKKHHAQHQPQESSQPQDNSQPHLPTLPSVPVGSLLLNYSFRVYWQEVYYVVTQSQEQLVKPISGIQLRFQL